MGLDVRLTIVYGCVTDNNSWTRHVNAVRSVVISSIVRDRCLSRGKSHHRVEVRNVSAGNAAGTHEYSKHIVRGNGVTDDEPDNSAARGVQVRIAIEDATRTYHDSGTAVLDRLNPFDGRAVT